MQVSSVSIPNGRIRSAVPLEESNIETHAKALKLAETRMSRVEMEREESVHDDLVFEYSSRYREFSGKARRNQTTMSIQSLEEDDYKENRQSKKDPIKKSNDLPYKKSIKQSDANKIHFFPDYSRDQQREKNNYESENSEEDFVLENRNQSKSKKGSNNLRSKFSKYEKFLLDF